MTSGIFWQPESGNIMSFFSNELFTANVNDYRLEDKSIIPKSNLFRGTFGPLEFPCFVRVIKMDESDVDLYENEIHIDQLTEHKNIIKMLCHFMQDGRIWYSVFPLSP